MNLDLLKKLTKLANNNPNDHEANLAARKVCKILEEGNWSLPSLAGSFNYQPTQAQRRYYEGPDPFWEEMKRRADDEKKRREEMENEIKRRNEEAERKRVRYNPFDPKFSDFSDKYNPQRRMRKCTMCGEEEMTSYQGNKFICFGCIDEAARKSR